MEKDIKKEELEQFLNVIIDLTAEAVVDWDEGFIDLARKKILQIQTISSNAIQYWNMREYTESDGQKFHDYIKNAYDVVYSFKRTFKIRRSADL